MLKDTKIINSKKYIIGVNGRLENERYKFKMQFYSQKGKPASYLGWVSEEFIEDNIDNSKSIDFLEKLTLEVAKNHLEDILKLSPYTIAKKINYWFRETKRQLDEKGQDEKTNQNSD